MNYYIVGQLAKLVADPFTDEDTGLPIDPTVVNLTVGIEVGSETVYTYGVGNVIVRDGVGQYHADIDTSLFEAGLTYFYKWWSTGTGQTVNECPFGVVAASV